MAISSPQINRQLRKDGGILTIDDARRMAPPGEDLAYINPEEAALLKSLGGAGEDINGTGIKSYFIKKIFKKAKKAVKKVVKSPIGKAAILGGLTFGVPGTGFKGFLGAGKGGGLGSIIKRSLFGTSGKFLGPASKGFMSPGTSGLLGKLGLTKGGGSMGLTGLGKIAGIGGLAGLAGLAAAGEQDDEEEFDLSKVDRGEGLNILDIVARARKNDPEFRFLPPVEFQNLAEGGGVGSLAMNEENVKQKFVSDEAGALPKKGGGVTPDDMGKLKQSDFDSEEDYKRYLRQLNRKAEGGEVDKKTTMIKDMLVRGADDDLIKAITGASQKEIDSLKNNQAEGKAEGGLINLGGMEMDLRGGGFVPLGAKEKADDVPARLSKNEFVMTADAVRAAGGGSVDKGADKMYNLMKDLESRV